MLLQDIYVYPVKSLRGFRVDEWPLDDFGLKYDRRWMLVDENGEFITQRSHPELSQFNALIENDTLQIEHRPSTSKLKLEIRKSNLGTVRTKVWSYESNSQLVSQSASEFFSDLLHFKVNLVFMPDSVKRPLDTRYAPKGHRAAFSDGFPLLVISQESLDDINSRLQDPVPMDRFRPNLVISGTAPYGEDQLDELEIGDARIKMVKPCSRCTLITTDQNTGVRSKEPLKTLATYRTKHNNVLFGMNAIILKQSTVEVGTEIY